MAALERAKLEKEATGEIETQHPGYLGAQDTYYVGTIKGVGRIYQQSFIDTYSKVAQVKVYTDKNALTAAEILNDRVIPFYETHHIPLLRILTDRGTEYCGRQTDHAYQLYLAIEDIDHTRTRAKSPQTNGICERFHLDDWIAWYNQERTHSGKYCYGKTPLQTFLDSLHLAKQKQLDTLAAHPERSASGHNMNAPLKAANGGHSYWVTKHGIPSSEEKENLTTSQP